MTADVKFTFGGMKLSQTKRQADDDIITFDNFVDDELSQSTYHDQYGDEFETNAYLDDDDDDAYDDPYDDDAYDASASASASAYAHAHGDADEDRAIFLRRLTIAMVVSMGINSTLTRTTNLRPMMVVSAASLIGIASAFVLV